MFAVLIGRHGSEGRGPGLSESQVLAVRHARVQVRHERQAPHGEGAEEQQGRPRHQYLRFEVSLVRQVGQVRQGPQYHLHPPRRHLRPHDVRIYFCILVYGQKY